MPDTNLEQPDHYLVYHQGEILGPFDLNFIEAMVMSGVYPSSVVVENIATKMRHPFTSIVPNQKTSSTRGVSTAGRPQKPRSSRQKSTTKKIEAIVIKVAAVIGVVVVIWIISILKSDAPSPNKKSTALATTSSKSSYNEPRETSSSGKYASSSRSSSSYGSGYSSTRRTSSTEKRSSSSYSKPRTTSPPVDTMVYRDAFGRTYRVSNSDYNRLQVLKSALNVKQGSLERSKSRLKSLAREVDNDRYSLDRTSQYQIDNFNRKVNRVNLMNGKVQSLVDDYNRDVDSFNRELERVGTPIR